MENIILKSSIGDILELTLMPKKDFIPSENLINLSKKEFKIIETLYNNLNFVCDYDTIALNGWGVKSDYYINRTASVFICSLNKKIAKVASIVNSHGEGYYLKLK